MDVQTFLEYVLKAVDLCISMVGYLTNHWYFALLFAVALLWVGFDLIEGLLQDDERNYK
ncbi:MAG: hypothetical protein J6S67_24275 [Methanobrevibacter sp.]|nr:hypothetical protein [Methanobrevibacter sp.]